MIAGEESNAEYHRRLELRKLMNPRVAAPLGAYLLIWACTGAVTLTSSRDPLPAEPRPAPIESVESEAHQLVNRHRGSRGLQALHWDARIADMAREHSRAMASRRRAFGHDGFDQRAAALGREMSIRSLAENVAYDSRTGAALAPHVVNDWIASAGHRQNLEGGFTHTGIGVALGADGVSYFTQIFVSGN